MHILYSLYNSNNLDDSLPTFRDILHFMVAWDLDIGSFRGLTHAETNFVEYRTSLNLSRRLFLRCRLIQFLDILNILRWSLAHPSWRHFLRNLFMEIFMALRQTLLVTGCKLFLNWFPGFIFNDRLYHIWKSIGYIVNELMTSK